MRTSHICMRAAPQGCARCPHLRCFALCRLFWHVRGLLSLAPSRIANGKTNSLRPLLWRLQQPGGGQTAQWLERQSRSALPACCRSPGRSPCSAGQWRYCKQRALVQIEALRGNACNCAQRHMRTRSQWAEFLTVVCRKRLKQPSKH